MARKGAQVILKGGDATQPKYIIFMQERGPGCHILNFPQKSYFREAIKVCLGKKLFVLGKKTSLPSKLL